MENLFLILLLLMAVFLILLVLVQRGRGGGLAGALGGPGGSSAFGAKAGDTFTKITIYAASIWILTCVLAAYWAKNRGDALGEANPDVNRMPGIPADADMSLPSDPSDPSMLGGAGAAGSASPGAAEGEAPAGEETPAEVPATPDAPAD